MSRDPLGAPEFHWQHLNLSELPIRRALEAHSWIRDMCQLGRANAVEDVCANCCSEIRTDAPPCESCLPKISETSRRYKQFPTTTPVLESWHDDGSSTCEADSNAGGNESTMCASPTDASLTESMPTSSKNSPTSSNRIEEGNHEEDQMCAFGVVLNPYDGKEEENIEWNDLLGTKTCKPI